MGLIVYKPDDLAVFTDIDFSEASSQSQGIGIMFVEDGRLNVVKKIGKYKEQLKLFNEHKNRQSYAAFLGYSEYEDRGLCPPLHILNKEQHGLDLWMMQSAPVPAMPDIQREYSNAWHMVALQLAPILENNPELIFSPFFQDMITSYIGNTKMLFMTNQNDIVLLNKEKGLYMDGCWLSHDYNYDEKDIIKPYNSDEDEEEYSGSLTCSTPIIRKESKTITVNNFVNKSKSELKDFVKSYPEEAATLLYNLGDEIQIVETINQ